MTQNKPVPAQSSESQSVGTEKLEKMKRLLQNTKPDADPEALISKFSKLIAEHKGSGDSEISPELSKAFNLALSGMSLDSHVRLADTTTEKLAPLAIAVAKQLIDEYDCQNTAEKTLAETVANAYIRILRYSEALNSVYSQGTTTPELNKYMNITSMELDRANRQYLTALTALKTFKQPGVHVTFKANTAFVAQNQQVNANPTPPEEPKQ